MDRPDRITKPAELTRIALERLAPFKDFTVHDIGRGDVKADYKDTPVSLSGNIRGGFCVTLHDVLHGEGLSLEDAASLCEIVARNEKKRVEDAAAEKKAEIQARFDALPEEEKAAALARRAEKAKEEAEAKIAEAKEAAANAEEMDKAAKALGRKAKSAGKAEAKSAGKAAAKSAKKAAAKAAE